MGQDHLATRMAEALVTMLILSGPPLAAAVVIGVVVGSSRPLRRFRTRRCRRP